MVVCRPHSGRRLWGGSTGWRSSRCRQWRFAPLSGANSTAWVAFTGDKVDLRAVGVAPWPCRQLYSAAATPEAHQEGYGDEALQGKQMHTSWTSCFYGAGWSEKR